MQIPALPEQSLHKGFLKSTTVFCIRKIQDFFQLFYLGYLLIIGFCVVPMYIIKSATTVTITDWGVRLFIHLS